VRRKAPFLPSVTQEIAIVSESISKTPPRIAREQQTVGVMIAMYCRAHHGGKGSLCAECGELSDYALGRLQRCPFGEHKTPCAQCKVHCYRPAMRTRIQAVMRWAGPRMLFRHPILAIRHQWDGLVRRGRK
jgi:hypothetical protein